MYGFLAYREVERRLNRGHSDTDSQRDSEETFVAEAPTDSGGGLSKATKVAEKLLEEDTGVVADGTAHGDKERPGGNDGGQAELPELTRAAEGLVLSEAGGADAEGDVDVDVDMVIPQPTQDPETTKIAKPVAEPTKVTEPPQATEPTQYVEAMHVTDEVAGAWAKPVAAGGDMATELPAPTQAAEPIQTQIHMQGVAVDTQA